MNAVAGNLAGGTGGDRADFWTAERQANAASLGALVLLLTVGVSASWSFARLTEARRWVAHTQEVLGTLDEAVGALSEAVAAVRGYVISGHESYLTERGVFLSRLESDIQQLKQLTADNAEQTARIAQLERLIHMRRSLMDHALVARQLDGVEAARQIVASGEPDRVSAAIRAMVEELKAAEHELLRVREVGAQRGVRTVSVLAALTILIACAVIVLGWQTVRHELVLRRTLLESQERDRRFLASVINNMPNALIVKGARDLRIVDINQVGARLLGRPEADIVGRHASELLPAEYASAVTERDREALCAGTIEVPSEVVGNGIDAERVLWTRRVVVPDAEGRPAYLINVFDDVTRQRAAEQEILALNERLERQSRLLEMSNRDLESFSYSVSHDLRAPLRAVDGFAQMLEEDYGERLDDEGRRFIRVIRDGSRRMNRLIDDLLSFARVGRQQLIAATVDMTELARAAADEVLAALTGVAPQIDIEDLPLVQGDASLLRQVWLNLLDNAVKYSAGSVTPRVRVSGELTDGEAVFGVEDNGAGFDMRYAEKLFRVFQRLHGMDEFPGTGVGLAIVKSVIERHGGRVRAQGTPGAGARFEFVIPVGAPQ